MSPSDYFQANPQNRIKAGHRGSYDDGSFIESYDDDDYKIKTPEKFERDETPEKFERDDHVICRPLVRGFSLTLKAWREYRDVHVESGLIASSGLQRLKTYGCRVEREDIRKLGLRYRNEGSSFLHGSITCKIQANLRRLRSRQG